jgi:hypothetical protein
MFKWRSREPFVEKDDFFFMSWKDRFGDRAAEDWRFSGHLEFNRPRYYVVKSPKHDEYVSTFGPIPGLMLLPFVAPFYAKDHDLAAKLIARATIGKLGASVFVATTAVLLFLVAERWLSRRRALLVTLTYALGTCAWAVSSQNVWQQTVNQLFLMLGAYFFLGDASKRRTAFLAGLAFGTAVACRATGLVVLVAVLVHVHRHARRGLVPMMLGALPVPLAVAAYNLHYFGSPFVFAQELVGHVVAMEKTGSPNLWQTPFWLGALGLLISPSRGVLVFSPVLAASVWGAVRAFRDDSFRDLRPLTVGAFITMAIQCKWFDWWGGHAFGYRPWLDAVPYLCLLLIPVMDPVFRTRLRSTLFGAALAWSVFVQALGAFSYDRSWNLRRIFVVRLPHVDDPISFLKEPDAEGFAAEHGGQYLGPSFCDIDLWFCRKRLWSLKDNLIWYQITDFRENRGRRLQARFTEPNRW